MGYGLPKYTGTYIYEGGPELEKIKEIAMSRRLPKHTQKGSLTSKLNISY
jgi:hypothetical protein